MAGAVSSGVGRRGSTRSSGTWNARHTDPPDVRRNTDERPHHSLYDGTMERTADGGVIRFERHLAYPIRDVWDAITNPARLADWWLPFDADITVDLREGGEMVMAADR